MEKTCLAYYAPTFVVVPTTALIDDMLVRCQNLDIASCKFTGCTSKEHQKSQLENFGSYKIILATPEMVEGDLLDKIMSSKAERIVFDEAHTITTWGNTFRPVYKAICEQLSPGCYLVRQYQRIVKKSYQIYLVLLWSYETLSSGIIWSSKLKIEQVAQSFMTG